MKQLFEKSKPVIDHLKSWLGIGAIVCAGVITPWEYLEVKQEKRVERTLAYVERYGDGDYADSAIALDEAVNNQYTALSKLLKNTELSTPELEKRYAKLILGMFEDPGLASAMNSVLRFHEELVQCILNDLCDREVAMSFFLNSTGDMLRTYYPYICDKRSKWNDPQAYQTIEHFYLGKSKTSACQKSG
ncbi:MAG: hypothetical protein GY806_11875 [Gammaproteobacteria bacterium]|nr:hypothetical protein [Gammaproteobacteria bacterium]